MGDIDKLTNDTISKGGVLALLYFDLHGSSKEVLNNMGTGFVDRVLKEPGVIFALAEIQEPIQTEGLYSTSLELKVLTTGMMHIAHLCANYSPFSIEILRPDKIELSIDKAHELLMYIASTTFEYKKHIIERVARPEEVEAYKKGLLNKIALGKRVLEEKGEKKK